MPVHKCRRASSSHIKGNSGSGLWKNADVCVANENTERMYCIKYLEDTLMAGRKLQRFFFLVCLSMEFSTQMCTSFALTSAALNLNEELFYIARFVCINKL